MSAAQDNAHLMAEHALRVVPIGVGQKHPPIQEWQIAATSETETIDSWFDTHPEWGLGWKMGAQDDGRFLFAIDVDVNKGGRESFRDLIEEYGLADEFKATTTARTGGGGFHFVFELPDNPVITPNNRSRLRAGIDVRAEGGQIVVAPTLHPTTHKAYAWEPGMAPWQLDPQVASPGLMQMIADLQAPVTLALVDETMASIARHPSQQTGILSPADFVHYHWDFATFLNKHDWDWMGGERWRRPGKADRGASAMLKGDGLGPLNVFTTEIPEALEHLGKLDATGQCISVTLFNFVAAYEHDGDTTALSRRVMVDPAYVEHVGATPARAVTVTPPPGDDTPRYRLPVVEAEYWSASARNRHIFTAARAAMVSPDALDLVVFALEATLIPPNYLLPRIVGGQQPLNMLSCLVAPTGVFKTSTLDAARDVMGPFPPWVVQIGMGSGEGIGATFLEDETEVNTKSGKSQKTGRLKRNNIQAAFFEADEGSGLSEQAARNGATIIANLCKAWSGSTLGEANADPTKRRHVLDRDYRIAALVNIQPSAFAQLFSIANTGTGLTGRFMFSGTADYDIPDDDTPWPGILEHPRFPSMPLTLEIDEAIIAEAKAKIRQRHRTASLSTTIDAVGQNAAVVARMAGIAVLVDDRRRITVDDWAVAEMRARTSAACLETLADWSISKESDLRYSQDSARARSAVTIEVEAERIKIGRAVDRILAVLTADGPMSGGNLTAKMTGSIRPLRDDALELLVSMGKVRLVGERWECL